jgi:predicted Zn-dependent protease
LELTWTFASVGRLEEAEAAARHAVALDNSSAAAHGNLARVLYQGDRPAEALPVIERALELAPSDSINRRIRAAVQLALERPPADPPRDPWYWRWFRRP